MVAMLVAFFRLERPLHTGLPEVLNVSALCAALERADSRHHALNAGVARRAQVPVLLQSHPHLRGCTEISAEEI